MIRDPIRVLFVCLGNICRSPAAESVFNALVERAEHRDRFEVESAGTGGWHIGELPDARMRRCGEKRGFRFESRARQFIRDDFKRFDHIVVMDDNNFRDVIRQATSDAERSKVIKMASYHSSPTVSEVPDPYYGGVEGFEHVLDILEDACSALLSQLDK